MAGRLRIVSGLYRGRRIAVPPAGSVRPTGERVREALFDILGEWVRGRRVLDAYAGSGALGIEALSRGALAVTFVEADPAIAACVRRNLGLLGVEPLARVVVGSIESVLGRQVSGEPFDLVLADPPYDDPGRMTLLGRLLRPGLLSGGARVAVERRTRDAQAVAEGWTCTRSARYGDTSLDFYDRAPPPA